MFQSPQSPISAPQPSPDSDLFSTPLSTPTMSSASSVSSASDNEFGIRPSLPRRTSRPSSILIDKPGVDWTPAVQLEAESPELVKVAHRNPSAEQVSVNRPIGLGLNLKEADAAAAARNQLTPQPRPHQPKSMHNTSTHRQAQTPSLKSPCFVHSFLDKGASLADWLRSRTETDTDTGDVAVAKSLQVDRDEHPVPPSQDKMGPKDLSISPPSVTTSSSPSDYDEDDAGSLTRRLAETAVGVREVSKQLGRARVRSNIQNVLIITKARDNRLIQLTRELALYLMKKPRSGGRGLVVYVDNQLRYSKRFDAAGIQHDHPELFLPSPRRRSSSSLSLSSLSSKEENMVNEEGQLRYWTSDMCSHSPHLFDFVVTLGGDGTVLFTSWLFQRIVPPVLPFALGSLGFLTNFDFADYAGVMDSVIDSGIRVNLRMRFTCTVYRAVAPEEGKGRRAVKKGETGEIMMKNIEEGGWEALEGGWSGSAPGDRDGRSTCSKDKEIMCFTTRPVETFEVLNDLVVDRGPSPYVSLLELFGDEHHMTTVQADGLTVSTPTGSTAYSLSAGGSLVHPEIPAILITPICPHTLSFRPMLLPDSMELRICVPFNSRSTAWASFDGRGRVELKQGDHIKITASKYPFPTVCADKQSTDWFHAISRTLKWNERERQKSFVVVEEGPAKPKKRGEHPAGHSTNKPRPEVVAEDDEEDEVSDGNDSGEDVDEEHFDIDDLSTGETSGLSADDSVHIVAKQKARDVAANHAATARDAAIALSKGNPLMRVRSSSRSRPGIDSPDRFAGPHPHPPRVSPRHVQFADTALSSSESTTVQDAQKGSRDHIHSPQLLSGGRSRIPKDRDVDAESMKTPTNTGGSQGARRSHNRSSSHDYDGHRRTFAVWGQDESDSNASDSDV